MLIAGMGSVSGYGIGAEALWSGVVSGRSAGSIHTIDGREVLLARVPEFPDGDGATRMESAVFAAVDEAYADAESRGWSRGTRLGVIYSTGIGDIQLARDGYFRPGAKKPRPSMFAHVLHTTIPSLVAKRLGATGRNVIVNAACASTNVAAITAAEWLASGAASDVLVVAAEFCAIDEVLHGFRQLQVLFDVGDPMEVCVPFGSPSKGFFLGEAAVAFVLSGDSSRPYARVLGGAWGHDAYHVSGIKPDGSQVRQCFEDAVVASRVDPEAVAYVNAHGTGTKLNDSVESEAVLSVLPRARFYSTKPFTGHCMAASAAVELVVAAKTYECGTIPGTSPSRELHPRAVRVTERRSPGITLKSAIGIGGYNSALLMDEP